MESEPRYGNAPPLPILGLQPYNGLKLEVIDDDFCCIDKTYLQDFHHLDQLPLIKASPFNPDVDTHTVFDPFIHGFDLYEENKAYDHGNGIACAMQSFQGDGGFLSFANRKDDPFTTSISVVPDESSCITADHFHKGSVNAASTTKTGRRKAKSGKGQWTAEEDRVLIHLVEKHGEKKWSRIAQLVKGRIGKQCRERWHNHLRPDIKKDVWTEEEDRILMEGHAEMGNKWAEIAKRLPGRTENSIKNHWNATKRRRNTKCPRPTSLLQNYIKNLTIQKGNTSSSDTPTNLSNNTLSDIFMDELPPTPPPQIQDEPCFDVEFPFDMPPLMLKEELDFELSWRSGE